MAPEANILGKSQPGHLSEPVSPVRRGEESDSEGGLQWSQECGLLHPRAEGTLRCPHTPTPSLPPGSLATVSPGVTPDTVPGRGPCQLPTVLGAQQTSPHLWVGSWHHCPPMLCSLGLLPSSAETPPPN